MQTQQLQQQITAAQAGGSQLQLTRLQQLLGAQSGSDATLGAQVRCSVLQCALQCVVRCVLQCVLQCVYIYMYMYGEIGLFCRFFCLFCGLLSGETGLFCLQAHKVGATLLSERRCRALVWRYQALLPAAASRRTKGERHHSRSASVGLVERDMALLRARVLRDRALSWALL